MAPTASEPSDHVGEYARGLASDAVAQNYQDGRADAAGQSGRRPFRTALQMLSVDPISLSSGEYDELLVSQALTSYCALTVRKHCSRLAEPALSWCCCAPVSLS